MTIERIADFADSSELDAIDAIYGMEDCGTLRVVEAIARAKAENAELKRERERLRRRIAQEDARLAHA